ncbi:MAG: hypothetical protein P8Y70_19000, partial [Candidatus Lokiarchaeota archaeon]
KKLLVPYDDEKTHTTTGFDLGHLQWLRPNLNKQTEGVLVSEEEYKREKVEYEGWHVRKIELKGCPGQMQFTEVRKIICKGSNGVIFLIDGSDLSNIGNSLVILEETKASLGEDIPMRIIANKSDRDDFNDCEIISDMIGSTVFPGSGKCCIGVKDAIIDILKMIKDNIKSENLTEHKAVV